MPSTDIDLVDPDNYVERVPFEWFEELRHTAPVSWHEEPAAGCSPRCPCECPPAKALSSVLRRACDAQQRWNCGTIVGM